MAPKKLTKYFSKGNIEISDTELILRANTAQVKHRCPTEENIDIKVIMVVRCADDSNFCPNESKIIRGPEDEAAGGQKFRCHSKIHQ